MVCASCAGTMDPVVYDRQEDTYSSSSGYTSRTFRPFYFPAQGRMFQVRACFFGVLGSLFFLFQGVVGDGGRREGRGRRWTPFKLLVKQSKSESTHRPNSERFLLLARFGCVCRTLVVFAAQRIRMGTLLTGLIFCCWMLRCSLEIKISVLIHLEKEKSCCILNSVSFHFLFLAWDFN